MHIDLTVGRLQLAGSLIRSTTFLFHDAITILLLQGNAEWLVDATELDACDLVGVRSIGTAYRRALRHNRRMTLAGASTSLRHELTRLRLDRHLLEAVTTTVRRLGEPDAMSTSRPTPSTAAPCGSETKTAP
ncbi:STAS domain-containing protein [Blastococcus sp. LR1]|uniref:STAS domain-containing protein n=1 Tax=Blastococcus sp. LR1 TaxID=2877000 RepID=UPI001CCA5469|nr:STAS domain-containing protein [Blastococcus sp. LR1]MCA0143986.1 STAS domain-containing protein [Blastococcus sp. LR1]